MQRKLGRSINWALYSTAFASILLGGCAREGCGRVPPDPEPADCKPEDKECNAAKPRDNSDTKSVAPAATKAP